MTKQIDIRFSLKVFTGASVFSGFIKVNSVRVFFGGRDHIPFGGGNGWGLGKKRLL